MPRPTRNCWPPCAASAGGSRIFKQAILQHDVRLDMPNGYLKQRYRPLGRVGICVPGGAAAYPSTVLMTAVPAQVAGVAQLAVVAPPTPFGAFNPDLLATCRELGITEVYRLGGGPGRRRPGLRRRGHPARGQDRRARATSSSPWPSDTSTARSTSIPSPAPAKSW